MPAVNANDNRPVHVRVERRVVPAVRRVSRPAPASQPGPFTNQERRVVNQTRRSRPYFNAYQDAFNENPQVQRARQQIENPQTRKRGLKALERERRRGPDLLATEAYRHYLGNLWDRASGYYPRPNDQPGMLLDYGLDDYAQVRLNDQNTVRYSPQVPRQFMGPDEFNGGPNPARSHAQTVPLHEWAHTRQGEVALQKRALAEGGAEAVEQDLARALGLHYPGGGEEYEGFARKVRHRLGRDWVRKGQYMDLAAWLKGE